MIVAGLTGNYGMGKSTVLGFFRELGAVTLKADEIVDSLLRDETVVAKLRDILGAGIFTDGALDKGKVASLIFRDGTLRDAVEGLLHPLVFRRIEDFLEGLGRDGRDDRIVVIEIPLLFEKGCAGIFGRTITVFADGETAMRRLEGAGVSREDAAARLKVQMPVAEKVRLSDFAIDNSGSMEDTRAQVAAVYHRLLEAGQK